MSGVRNPAVSGMFYPGDRNALEKMVGSCLRDAGKNQVYGNVLGVVVPHAGYIYSGVTAAYAYTSVQFSGKKVLLIGPNHSSYPYYTAIYNGQAWKTPLGEVPVDSMEIERLAESSSLLIRDSIAHETEHSLEVQLPFLQAVTGNRFSFVPILLGDQSEQTVIELAESLIPLISGYMVVASSDLNHYEDLKTTEFKDRSILDAIMSLDIPKFYETIVKTRASPCGYGAIAFLMALTRKAGGRMLLLHHTTSAEFSGDESSVVGYASIVALGP